MRLSIVVPSKTLCRGVQFFLDVKLLGQHPTQVFGIAVPEGDVRKLRYPAYVRGDHRGSHRQGFGHAHRPAFVKCGHKNKIHRTIEIGKCVLGDELSRFRPAGTGEMPVDAFHVHQLRHQPFALAPGVIGSANDPNAQLGHEAV